MGIHWGSTRSQVYETDPSILPISQIRHDKIYWEDTVGTNSGFWDTISTIGSTQSADPSTAQRTIVSVSGRGRLTGVIGPETTGTTTFEITIDGTPYTFSVVNNDNPSRVVLGDILRRDDLYTTANRSGGYAINTTLARGSNNISAFLRASRHEIMNPAMVHRFCKFNTGLTVKVQITAASLGGNGADVNAGALWNLDG